MRPFERAHKKIRLQLNAHLKNPQHNQKSTRPLPANARQATRALFPPSSLVSKVSRRNETAPEFFRSRQRAPESEIPAISDPSLKYDGRPSAGIPPRPHRQKIRRQSSSLWPGARRTPDPRKMFAHGDILTRFDSRNKIFNGHVG